MANSRLKRLLSTEAFSFFSACIRVPFKFFCGLFLLACLLLVRVPLLGQIVIGFLDVLLAGILWNAQDPKRPARRTRGTSRKHITIWPNCGTRTRRRKDKRKRPRRTLKATLIQAGGSHFQLFLSHLLPNHLQLFPSHRGNESTNGEHQISWHNIHPCPVYTCNIYLRNLRFSQRSSCLRTA